MSEVKKNLSPGGPQKLGPRVGETSTRIYIQFGPEYPAVLGGTTVVLQGLGWIRD